MIKLAIHGKRLTIMPQKIRDNKSRPQEDTTVNRKLIHLIQPNYPKWSLRKY